MDDEVGELGLVLTQALSANLIDLLLMDHNMVVNHAFSHVDEEGHALDVLWVDVVEDNHMVPHHGSPQITRFTRITYTSSNGKKRKLSSTIQGLQSSPGFPGLAK